MIAKFELIDFFMTDQKTFFCDLGKRLADLRKEQGLTQVRMAELTKCSQQLIAEYEAGRMNIPVWRLLIISETLGVSVDFLLKDSSTGTRKRGPAPKLQKQIEKISSLPKEQQKSILQVLDMALNSKA